MSSVGVCLSTGLYNSMTGPMYVRFFTVASWLVIARLAVRIWVLYDAEKVAAERLKMMSILSANLPPEEQAKYEGAFRQGDEVLKEFRQHRVRAQEIAAVVVCIAVLSLYRLGCPNLPFSK